MVRRRMGIMAVLLSLFLCFMPWNAGARTTADAGARIDTTKECALNLSYSRGDVRASGQRVKLYQIAEVSPEASYHLTRPFADTGLSLNGIRTNHEWDVIRSTMEAYILANNITPTKIGVTDVMGRVLFTGLKPGLYLASEVQMEHDGYTYLFDSALIALPGLKPNGDWQYGVSVAAKSEELPPISPDETIEYKVVKLWKDDGGQKDRPTSVEIEIFCDGISHEKKVLSEENNWAYNWTAKDDGAVWQVVERNVPEGYTVAIEERSKTFVLINTLAPDDPDDPDDPDTPKDPDDPDTPKVPDDSDVPDEPDVPVINIEDPPDVAEDPDEPDTPHDPDELDTPEDTEVTTGDVPKTGDTSNILLYAVLMFVSGSLLLILGMTGKRNRYEEK